MYRALCYGKIETQTIYKYIDIYIYISHALKNATNQRPGLPLHILQYATVQYRPRERVHARPRVRVRGIAGRTRLHKKF